MVKRLSAQDDTSTATTNINVTSGSITGITDLAIADGGTGSSTAANAFTALKQAASETATGVVELATDAETTTGTDTTRAITPANLTSQIGTRIQARNLFNAANYADLQTAINAASTAGGGEVYIPSGTTHSLAAKTTLKTDVGVHIMNGAVIEWTGSAGGTMFDTVSTVPTLRTGVYGEGRINPDDAAYVFDLHSVQESVFDIAYIESGTTTLVIMRLRADAAATTGGIENTANCSWNTISLNCGQCGSVLISSGTTSPVTVVTENTFKRLASWRVCDKGISLVNWTDNNQYDQVRMELYANNSIGIVINDSGSPTVFSQIYAEKFGYVAIDAFAGPTGRKGMVVNNSYGTIVELFHQDPTAEGGALDVTNSVSHFIRAKTNDPATSTNFLEVHAKGLHHIREPLTVRSDLVGTDAVIKSENIANSGRGILYARGKTSGATVVEAAVGAADGYSFVGTTTGHPTLHLWGGAEQARFDGIGFVLASGKSVILPSTQSADVTGSGIVCIKTAGETLAFGDVVYFKSDGKAWKADADSAGLNPAVAMALGAIGADAGGYFLLTGFARKDAWSWTIGGPIFLSTTAGGMTQTQPSGSSEVVQILGIAHPDADTIYFRPNLNNRTPTQIITDLGLAASTMTLTNKRIEPRVVSAASYTTDTGSSLSVATADLFVVTAQAGALKFNNPGGTPVEGQKLLIRIKDNGTARALTYDTQFRAMGVALPTTTVISKWLYMGFIFNSTDTKWDLLASGQEA